MPFYYDLSTQHDNAFLRFVRRIYKPLHFEKGYNFPLWIIFGGALFGFGCARVMYFDYDGIFARTKGINADWLYISAGHERVGMIMHLAGVIPACFLVVWQFLPVIRHKLMIFHRINGFINILLLLIGNAGAFMIARNSMGGSVDSQAMIGLLGIYTTFCLMMAFINITRLQIDQHRAWMLRTWVVAGEIISLRLIQMAAYQITSRMGDYYLPMSCRTIGYITSQYGPSQAMRYAACREDPVNGWAAVNVNFFSTTRPDQIGASISLTFGVSGMIAFFLHAFGVEVYLALTRAEGDRLKQVSYEKQVARGWKRPGDSSHLTPNLWGDLPRWEPVTPKDSRKSLHEEGVAGGSDNGSEDLEAVRVVSKPQ